MTAAISLTGQISLKMMDHITLMIADKKMKAISGLWGEESREQRQLFGVMAMESYVLISLSYQKNRTEFKMTTFTHNYPQFLNVYLFDQGL